MLRVLDPCTSNYIKLVIQFRFTVLASKSWAWRGNKTTSYFDFLLGGRRSAQPGKLPVISQRAAETEPYVVVSS